MSTNAPSAPDIEGGEPGQTSTPHPVTKPALPTEPKEPAKPPKPTKINLCGLECVFDTQNQSCFQYIYQCAPWRAIFKLILHMLLWIAVASVSIYMIATAQPVINDCRPMMMFARHDCLNRNNNSLIEYAFGFCLLFFSVVKFIMIFSDDDPPNKCTCVNGMPNDEFCKRFWLWFGFVGTLAILFTLIYCAQFMEDCERPKVDRGNSPEQDACESYQRNELAGQLAGMILSGIAFPIVCVLWFIWICQVYKCCEP